MNKLAEMMRLYSRIEERGVRELGKEIGISPATVSRLMNGKELSTPNFLKVINWLLDEPKKKARRWL